MATATLYDFNAERHLRSNRMENQKSGFVPMYRSILKHSWRKDVYLRTLWQDLLFAAQKEPRTVNFRGCHWQLLTGQLVTTLEDLGTNLCNREGEPTSRHAVKRMLAIFVKEGMISVHTEHRKGTVITLLNYSEYNQKIADLPAHNLAHYPAHNKSSDTKASEVGAAHIAEHYPAHHEQQCINNNINNTSENSVESSDTPSNELSERRPEAAIQHGKKWGTAEDLRAAEWLFAQVRLISGSAKAPNFAIWANDIRMMRERDGRDHREICELFKWACQDSFWQGNVLCPAKLRDKWTQLSIQRDKQRSGRGGSTTRPAIDFNNHDWAEGLEI